MPGTLLTTQATLPFLPEAVQWVEQGIVRMSGQSEPIMTYRIDGRYTEDARSQA
jgi:hypothetical protein